MEAVHQYLLSVTAVAIISGIVNSLTEGKGTVSSITKLLSGLLLTITVVRPILGFALDDLYELTNVYTASAEAAVQDGKDMAVTAGTDIIKSQTEAYILNKAVSLDLELKVEVTLDESYPYAPVSVSITGDASPYAKAMLSQMIEEDLAIPREAQQWTG